jgi:hypothetical protein
MNPFVNPNKRSVTLPTGCKDLIDVLNQMEKTDRETIQKFIRVVLFQASQDNAAELVVGKALPDSTTPIRYKIDETWHELSPFPSHIRPAVISELARMANFAVGQTAGCGTFDVYFCRSRSRWIVEITGVDGECRLICVRG